MSDPTNAPPGWYDDGRGQQRYWDGTQWTEHTAPLPADQAATRPYESADMGGAAAGGAAAAPQYADTTPFAGLPTPGPGGSPEPEKPNVLGIIALIAAAVGFVLACIPFVQVVAFVILPIALILSIVALFLKGRKWPAITGLIVSVVGGIIGAVVFAVVVAGVFGRVVDSGVLEEGFGDQVQQSDGALPSDEADDGPGDEGLEDDGGVAQVLSFGETMVWSNGVSMTVSEPEPFTPSDLAAGADQAVNLVFTLTITNDTGENLQPVVFSRLSSDGTESTRIFDVGAEGGQVGIPPTTAILPGESLTWREAYSVQSPNSLTMQTAPSFEYEDATFTNVPQ